MSTSNDNANDKLSELIEQLYDLTPEELSDLCCIIGSQLAQLDTEAKDAKATAATDCLDCHHYGKDACPEHADVPY